MKSFQMHPKFFLAVLIYCLIIGLPFLSSATHIVGGEMNYRCLGNNEYEISLVVFRDCDTGVPWFDNPATIGVFDGQSNSILFQRQVLLNSAVNDTLDIFLPDSCLIVNSSACIHTTTYTDTITLAPNPNGYIIAYQRCCRNFDIVNIVNPSDAGATYWTYISPAALGLCNSSALFNDFPRVYLCSGVPIAFDHAATDIDGDSIVYELCTPFNGGSTFNPVPVPPSDPPYNTIFWANPYSTNNMLGGSDPLAIDPQTGLLTGTPQNLGVFLVGICLKEYRNGVLISTTRRGFQHIVGTCEPKTTAAFDTIIPPCNKDLEVLFVNNSSIVSGGYLWLFDTLATSTEFSPKFTFPDTGQYTVTLIAGVGSPCKDTFSMLIDLDIRAVEASMSLDVFITPINGFNSLAACLGDTFQLYVSDAFAGYADSTSYIWAPDSVILSGQGTDSIMVSFNQETRYYVTVVNSFGCQDNVAVTVRPIEVLPAFDYSIPECNTDFTVNFNNNSITNPINNLFTWKFDSLGFGTATNPIFTFPDSGTYQVSLIAGIGTPCQDTFFRDVYVPLTGVQLTPTLTDQIRCRGDSIYLQSSNIFFNYSNSTSYSWTPTSAVAAGQGTDSILVVADSSVQIQLLAMNEFDCADSLLVNIDVLQVEAAFDTIDLSCNTSLSIPFVNNSTSNLSATNYNWDFSGLASSNASDPTFTFPDTGSYTVSLIVGVGSLCPDTAFWDLYLPLYGLQLDSLESVEVCQGDTVLLTVQDLLASYSAFVQYTWISSNPILSGQNSDSLLILANSNATVQLSAVNSHQCRDSLMASINVRLVEAAFDTTLLRCNTSLELPLENLSSSSPLVGSYLWYFDNLDTSTLENPSYIFPDTGSYLIQLIADANGPCPDTFQMPVFLSLQGLDISSNDVSVLCKEDTVLLVVTNSLDAYTDYVNYEWSPSGPILVGQSNDSAWALLDTTIVFTVVGTNSYGCLDTSYATGNIIYNSPNLGITAAPDSIFLGQSTQLNATDNASYNYQWLPDTSLSSLIQYDPTAEPRTTTTYYLNVVNEFGCLSTDSITVFIKAPICDLPVVFVPSAFSPDGDGHNDILYINGNNIIELNFVLYNRWGQKVFETNDQNIGWDGSFEGAALAPDVYGYYMQCTCDDGSQQFVKGNITLLK